MQEFYGAQDTRAKNLSLLGQNPRLGLYFFTTSRFTAGAQKYAMEQGMKTYGENDITTFVAKHSISLIMEFLRHNLPLSTVNGLYRTTPQADTHYDMDYFGKAIQKNRENSVKRHIEHVLPDAKKAKQTTPLDDSTINNALGDIGQKNVFAEIDNDFIVATANNVAETPTFVCNARAASCVLSTTPTLFPTTVAGAVSVLFAAKTLCDQSHLHINQSSYWETRNTLLGMNDFNRAKFVTKNWPEAMQSSKLGLVLQCAVIWRSIIKAPRHEISRWETEVRCTLSYNVDFLTRLSLGDGVLDKCDGSMSLERAIITGLTNPSVALLQSIPHSIFIEALRFCILEWQKNQISKK